IDSDNVASFTFFPFSIALVCFPFQFLARVLGVIARTHVSHPYMVSCFTTVARSVRNLFSSDARSFFAQRMPNPVVIEPTAEHKATVIWYHGLGDVGESWAEALRTIRHPNVKYICPTAGTRQISFQPMFPMTAWFDIHGLSMNSREDIEGIMTATKDAHKMIDAEIAAGIPSNKILVGGFSMGGALAINVGFRCKQKLGGVVALSGFLLRRTELPGTFNANRDTPYLFGHGTADEVVPYEWGQLTQQTLSKFCSNVSFKSYNGMGHSTCTEEMKELKNFIENLAK
ncbi:ath-1, partial [Pristionchus pacificus]